MYGIQFDYIFLGGGNNILKIDMWLKDFPLSMVKPPSFLFDQNVLTYM